MISCNYLRPVGRFDYIRYVGSLCLGGSYVVFSFGLACLFGNDEINGDARKILDLYVANEEESRDIPLPKGIPIDFEAKETVLSLRSHSYGFME